MQKNVRRISLLIGMAAALAAQATPSKAGGYPWHVADIANTIRAQSPDPESADAKEAAGKFLETYYSFIGQAADRNTFRATSDDLINSVAPAVRPRVVDFCEAYALLQKADGLLRNGNPTDGTYTELGYIVKSIPQDYLGDLNDVIRPRLTTGVNYYVRQTAGKGPELPGMLERLSALRPRLGVVVDEALSGINAYVGYVAAQNP